ncbi:MAG: beta-ketoacyl-[acyl-carrier-protein] synthase family protein, partial [Desulfovermiculus sp.]
MRAPQNRRVFAIGYDMVTPLGIGLEATWEQAVQGKGGFRKVTRCDVDCPSNIVGEVPGWDPVELDFVTTREAYNWNADFVFMTMEVCRRALARSGLEIDAHTGPRTAILIGSAVNGVDAFRTAMTNYLQQGPLRISPYLLPNLCANLPSGKASMLLGMTGPIFSPQGACASGNHAIGLGARMIRDGDCDFVLAGGVDSCIMPEIMHGFANMNATLKVREGDRASHDPSQASRPFSLDRKGMILSEGCGVVVLASEEALGTYGMTPLAEVLGVGWTSDAYHYTQPHPPTIIRAMTMAVEDAELDIGDIQYINAHGTSTVRGDKTEIACLRSVFGDHLPTIPISSNKSQ